MKRFNVNEYYTRFSSADYPGGPKRMNPMKEHVVRYDSISIFSKIWPLNEEDIARQEIDFLDRSFNTIRNSSLFIYRLDNSQKHSDWFPKMPYVLFDKLTKNIKVTFARNIFEEQRITVPQRTVIEELKNSDLIPKIEWLEQIAKLKETIEREVVINLPLASWQIGEDGSMSGNSNIWIKVPDIEKNVEIMTNVMEYYGYFLSFEEDCPGHDDWKILNFEACIGPKIDELVIKRIKKMYHVFPKINKKSILENGIVPKSENSRFRYPPRVFLLADYEATGKKVTADDIKDLSKKLLEAKLLTDYNPEKWFEWTCFAIDVSKLNEKTEFIYDPNLYPLSIFTSSAIPPEAISEAYDFAIADFDDF